MQPNAVHIWCLPFSAYGAYAAVNARLLSEDERGKAGRFIFECDKARYVTARAVLRCLLGGYLQADPAELRFSYGACGKPELAGDLTGRLRFNLSHAGDWAIYAVSRDSEIGIDIEALKDDTPWRQLVPLVFSANEQTEFAAIPFREKPTAFLRGWTRKEAYVKGCGDGLSLPLDAFDVPLGSIEHQEAVCVALDSSLSSGWWLHPITPIPGYIAALAVKNRSAQISVHHYRQTSSPGRLDYIRVFP